jgi:hypothetical protein
MPLLLIVGGLLAVMPSAAASPMTVATISPAASPAAAARCNRVRFTPARKIERRYVRTARRLNRHQFTATFNVRSNCPRLRVWVQKAGYEPTLRRRAMPAGIHRVGIAWQQPNQPARYRLIGRYGTHRFVSPYRWFERLQPTSFEPELNTPSPTKTKSLYVRVDVARRAVRFSRVSILLRSGRQVTGVPRLLSSGTAAVAIIRGLPRQAQVARRNPVNQRRSTVFSISRQQPDGNMVIVGQAIGN